MSKDDIEIFGIKRSLFNYEEAVLKNYNEKEEFESLLNKNLSNKSNQICLIHDGRKSLFFINFIINSDNIIDSEQNQFILNYFNTHLKFLEKFESTDKLNRIKIISTIFFHKHYVRKIFLHLFRIIFKCTHELSAYIKFDNHQLIKKLSVEDPEFHVSGFSQTKNDFKLFLNKNIKNKNIPKNIKNNHKIAQNILEKLTDFKRCKVFYCSFPIEIDKYEQNASKLYKQNNPESVTTLTDIDMVMVLFNKNKFELYIIEGKKQASGFEAATRNDFNNHIKPHLLHPDYMPEIKIVKSGSTKGGYICYKN